MCSDRAADPSRQGPGPERQARGAVRFVGAQLRHAWGAASDGAHAWPCLSAISATDAGAGVSRDSYATLNIIPSNIFPRRLKVQKLFSLSGRRKRGPRLGVARGAVRQHRVKITPVSELNVTLTQRTGPCPSR